MKEVPVPNPTLNSANITYSYTPVEGGIPVEYHVISNEVPVLVETSADIAVAKMAKPSPVEPGAVLTYLITVSNAGPSPAINTVLTDDIPSELENVEFSTDGGLTFLPWIGTYMLGTLEAGGIQTILIRGVLSSFAAGEIVNTAVVSSDTPDPNPDNNTSTVVTPILASADISVVKTANPSPVLAGEVLTYTLIISNAGPSTAIDVNLADKLPDELSNAEISTDGGITWSPFNGFAFLGNLEPGELIQILLRANVSEAATGSLTNTARVDSGTPDPNPDNNTSTVVTPVIPAENSADLSIIKTSAPNPVQPGGVLTYTLTIFNAGPSPAVNTVLTDHVPSVLTNVEYSLDGGLTWQPWTGTLNLGTPLAGSSITVLIRGTVSPSASGSIVNTATVLSDTPDPDPSNNTYTNTTEIASAAVADISVIKSGQPVTVTPGETLTYTVTVTNHGPDDAANVILYDEVPPELTGVQFSTDGGATWNLWINPFNLGLLPSGQSRTILIRGTVTAAACGSIFNTAVVKSDTRDPNPSNNTSSVNTSVEIEAGADLSIRKTACPNHVNRGNKLKYTLTVSNAGPETAEQVVVRDNLPKELNRPVYSLDDGQTYHPWTGSLDLGNLAPDSSVSIIISGMVNECAKGCIKNTAVVSSITPDPDLSNNRDSVTVKICECCRS